MAKSKQQLQSQLTDRFDVKADRNRYLSAIIGHPDGTVYVTDRSGYIWARLGGGNGQIIQVYTRGMLPAYNLPIVVYRLPHRPRDYGIVDLDIDAWASTGTGESNTGGYDGTAYLERHGEQHYYNAGDPVLVHLRAWTPLRIYPSSGFVIGVMPGLIPRSGADLEIVHQTLDLTSHVPAAGALYVLITVDASGILTATDGTAVDGILDLTLASIPDTPDNHFRLGAIRLYSGQTSIRETRTSTDVVDLRWPQEKAASPITMADLPAPIDIPHGGTGQITAGAAVNALLASQANNALRSLSTDGSGVFWGICNVARDRFYMHSTEDLRLGIPTDAEHSHVVPIVGSPQSAHDWPTPVGSPGVTAIPGGDWIVYVDVLSTGAGGDYYADIFQADFGLSGAVLICTTDSQTVTAGVRTSLVLTGTSGPISLLDTDRLRVVLYTTQGAGVSTAYTAGSTNARLTIPYVADQGLAALSKAVVDANGNVVTYAGEIVWKV